jgi:hypothetical protein
MAHRYGETIRMETEAAGEREAILRAFIWRGERYPVVEILMRPPPP